MSEPVWRTAARKPGLPGVAPNSAHEPALTLAMPSSIRIAVVLPAPFGPRSPVTEPSATSKLRPSTTVRAP